MKNFLVQICFAVICILASCSSGCISAQSKNSTLPDTQSKDKQLALGKLKTKKEGIQHYKDLIISTKCWSSMIDSIGLEFAKQAAREQLVETCPNAPTSISGTQSQVSRVGLVTCVMIIVSQIDVQCEG